MQSEIPSQRATQRRRKTPTRQAASVNYPWCQNGSGQASSKLLISLRAKSWGLGGRAGWGGGSFWLSHVTVFFRSSPFCLFHSAFLLRFPFFGFAGLFLSKIRFPFVFLPPSSFFLLAYSIAPRTPLGPGSCHVDTPTIPKDGQIFLMHRAMKGFNHCASYAPQLSSLNTLVEERGSQDCQENKLPYFPPVCIDLKSSRICMDFANP